jgi:biopolymer transport protein ExbB
MGIFDFIKAAGFVMFFLVPMAIVSIMVIVERLIAFKQYGDVAPGLLTQVLEDVRRGKDNEALRACEDRSGPVAACMAAVLRNRNLGQDEVEGLVDETGQGFFLRLERFLPILEVFTTVSPLLGLLGTIIGMIKVFQDFAASAAASGGSNSGVLSGVGEALYATSVGITIACICFGAYGAFNARLNTVRDTTANAVTTLINALRTRSTSSK